MKVQVIETIIRDFSVVEGVSIEEVQRYVDELGVESVWESDLLDTDADILISTITEIKKPL